jgi:hypothetical protein
MKTNFEMKTNHGVKYQSTVKFYKRRKGGYVTQNYMSLELAQKFVSENSKNWDKYFVLQDNNGGIHSYDIFFQVVFFTSEKLTAEKMEKHGIRSHAFRINIFQKTEDEIEKECLSFWRIAWGDGRY